MARPNRFFRFLLTVTGVIQVPFVLAAREALHRVGTSEIVAWLGGLALGAVGFFAFVGRARNIMNDVKRPYARVVLEDLPYYVHWCACLWCLVPSILYVLIAPAWDLAHGRSPELRGGFFMWTYAAGLVVCGYGVTLRRWWFVVREIEIPVRGLDPSFDGYRIAQLSDLHIGALTPKAWGHRWVRAANAAAPDMTVVTGDMVTSGTAHHDDIADIVGALRAPDGVFVSMGNHDYFGEGEPLISLLGDKGARVLRNAGALLERGDAKMYLAAIDDTWTRRADMDLALEGRPDGVPVVLLAHDPDKFDDAIERGVDVVLSGHTHGGQIAFPFLGRYINASKLAHRYHIGIYRRGDATLHVHPGLGTTGPPMRLGVAPAVVILKLRAV
ncbi:MAG: metallophosphoesterase [Polyangiaceae bacterium]